VSLWHGSGGAEWVGVGGGGWGVGAAPRCETRPSDAGRAIVPLYLGGANRGKILKKRTHTGLTEEIAVVSWY